MLINITVSKRNQEKILKPSTFEENTPKDDRLYLKKAIEIDAFAFAYYHMKEPFDVEVKIPELIQNQVLQKILVSR